MIERFDGNYGWLSNFAPCTVKWQNIVFHSVEAFYQAMKSADPAVIATFVNMTAREAKKAGKTVIMRDDWDDIKLDVMSYGLEQKFISGNNPELTEKLIATGNEQLVEGNWWHDNFWGDCYCLKCKWDVGQNQLGRMLMIIRDKLAKSATKVVHCKKEEFDIYIGRGSIWGNPFPINEHQDRDTVVKKYETYIRSRADLLAQLHTLKGKRLGCYCSPQACHGDVLVKLIKERGL